MTELILTEDQQPVSNFAVTSEIEVNAPGRSSPQLRSLLRNWATVADPGMTSLLIDATSQHDWCHADLPAPPLSHDVVIRRLCRCVASPNRIRDSRSLARR
ncbi:hypothetical protein OG563_34700 [Nocardia vinacea]|uniref:Uncharacterized protein n=1 Tax=Nocardia vinacea TaxID=96468 RepID=A0ABZ1YQX2_9NOCA|nr:hypothetical protein [Nocardia vinacea]